MNDKAKEWLFGSELPDRETLDKLKAEVNLPSEDDLREAFALCAWATSELSKSSRESPLFPTGMSAAVFQLLALAELLARVPNTTGYGHISIPLRRLIWAFFDQAKGHGPHPLLQPVRRPNHRSPRSMEQMLVMGLVARGIQLMREDKVQLEVAHRRAVREFNFGAGHNVLDWKTARKWRQNIMRGDAPPGAILVFKFPFNWLGTSSGERARSMMRLLRQMGQQFRFSREPPGFRGIEQS